MARTKTTKQYLDDRGAQWSDDDGLQRAEHYGEPDREYAAVVDEGLGIIDRGERDVLVISGDDAVPWLQGLVTNDLHGLVEEGNGHRNAFVNTTGRFVGETRILHLPRMLLLDLEPGNLDEGLYAHLRQHVILEDVELADRSDTSTRLGLYGQRAASVLTELADWEHDLSQRPAFFGTWSRWRGRDLIAQRVIWNRQPGFEICCDVETAVPLLEALDEKLGVLPLFGHRTFETLRIEDGVPRFGAELHDRVIPLEADFDDAIAYDKGCYLGQEIIARLDSRGVPAKRLRRVVLETDEVPEGGVSVRSDDDKEKKIGHVESAVFAPRFDAPVALAFVKRNYNDLGNTVRIEGAEGRLEPLMTLPSVGESD